MVNQSETPEKRNNNISVWLTDDEMKRLDQQLERVLRGLPPGVKLSRSAYVAELVRRAGALQASE